MKDQQFSTLSSQPWSDLPWKGEISHIHGCFHLSLFISLILLHKQSLPHKQLLQSQTMTLHAKQMFHRQLLPFRFSVLPLPPYTFHTHPRGDKNIYKNSHIQVLCLQVWTKNSNKTKVLYCPLPSDFHIGLQLERPPTPPLSLPSRRPAALWGIRSFLKLSKTSGLPAVTQQGLTSKSTKKRWDSEVLTLVVTIALS